MTTSRDDAADRTQTQALGQGTPGKRYRACFLILRPGEPGEERRALQSGRNVVGSGPACDVRLEDSAVSRLHFEITDQPEGFLLKDLGSKNGTMVNGTRAREVFLLPDALIEVGGTRLRFAVEKHHLEPAQGRSAAFPGLVAESPTMRELLGYVERIARTELSVLLLGETGSGKEVLARAIHEASSRSRGPYRVFDCASVDPGLMGAALFGHRPGAFTGAVENREGAFRSCDGGTLFIDEIGELPLDLQPKLLRVLEQREVVAIGADTPVKVDVRIVSATHRDLRQHVARDLFRRDLYYRLAGMVLEIPPLRERTEDILPLARRFLEQAGQGATIDASAERAIVGYPWPGNIRELRNVIERGAALAAGPVIRAKDLALDPLGPSSPPARAMPEAHQDDEDRRRIAEVLETTKGNMALAARTLGISRQTLYTRMEKLGLRRRGD